MPPARRRAAAARFPGAALPAVSLAADLPGAAVLAVPLRAGEGDGPPALLGDLPDVDVAALLERESAKGGPGELVTVPATGEQRVLLLGTGEGELGQLRKAGAALARRASDAASLAVDLRGMPLRAAELHALVEGLLLASYSFHRKAAPKERALTTITLVGTGTSAELDVAVSVVRATAAARDLVNTPSMEKSPAWLASAAGDLLQGLDVQVLDEKQLAARGFGGILGVGQGSSRPPRLISATYDGGGRTHVYLVGKGITFDTGGLSLKPNAGMLDMKMDMGGAAAVLGALRAVADLQLPITVTALAAAAENMPSGTAQRPGDVLTQYGGRTVEVLNTDAEGRLVLADAIAYAVEQGADVVVDVATLTGAMPVALGKKVAGLFTNDDALAAQLEAAAQASGEAVWRMPLVEDYRQALDSPIADLRNIGQPKLRLQGGSITAALFLREFTAGTSWAHLDIAGPAMSGGDSDEITKGGTGYGVRLLTAWLAELSRTPASRRPSRLPARRTAPPPARRTSPLPARRARRTA